MKKALMLIFALLVAALLLTGCVTPPNPGNQNGNNNKYDDWVIINNADDSDVYGKLLAGVMGSLRDMSTEKVGKSNPIIFVDSKVKLELNDHLLWLAIKLNYNYDNNEDMRFSAEIIDSDEKSIILGAYYMQNYLYLKIMDGEAGELKVPIENEVISKLFPIEFQGFKTETIIAAMSEIIVKNGPITGRSRLYGTISEYEYNFNINLPGTLQKIVNFINKDTMENLDTQLISEILQRIMGVSFEDIVDGSIPDSEVQVSFATSDNKITSFSFDLSIDQDEHSENTLFDGDIINLLFELEKLVIDKTPPTTPFIPFFASNEYKNYEDYLDKSFGLQLDVTQKGKQGGQDIPYKVKAELKLDFNDAAENELLFEILNDSGDAVTGAYIYRDTFYYYETIEEQYTELLHFEIDVLDVFDKIKKGITEEDEEDNGDSQPQQDEEEDDDEVNKTLEIVAYILGALSLSEERLSFVIDSGFYELVLPGFENIMEYIDGVLEDVDLENMFQEAGVDIVGSLMSNAFEISINIGEDAESFIYVVDGDIDFPEEILNAEPEQ
ncbi:MAG: hypothetical protein ACOYEC_00550 [Christensenellales bacterium]|jgi:hypothetical protein|nr:hypothetical protein [Clostridiales bacterium]